MSKIYIYHNPHWGKSRESVKILENSKKEFERVLQEIEKTGYCAIDTETNSLNIEIADLVGISLCCDDNRAYYIPINHKLPKNTDNEIKQLDQNFVLEIINKISSNSAILKIGHNIKYDIRILSKYKIFFNSRNVS